MGIGSFHPNGQPYQVKGVGSLFLKSNHIFNNPYEVMALLQQDWQIEIKTMSKHFAYEKNIKKTIDYTPLFKEISFIPSREPPDGELNNLSKIANY